MEDYNKINRHIDKVIKAYGGDIKDKCGKSWDAGQAVVRHMFGVDWMNSPEFKEMDSLEVLPQDFYDACNDMVKNKPDWMI